MEVHHVVPLHRGGRLICLISDLRSLCRTCHIAIHRRRDVEGADDWRRLLAGL